MELFYENLRIIVNNTSNIKLKNPQPFYIELSSERKQDLKLVFDEEVDIDPFIMQMSNNLFLRIEDLLKKIALPIWKSTIADSSKKNIKGQPNNP